MLAQCLPISNMHFFKQFLWTLELSISIIHVSFVHKYSGRTLKYKIKLVESAPLRHSGCFGNFHVSASFFRLLLRFSYSYFATKSLHVVCAEV